MNTETTKNQCHKGILIHSHLFFDTGLNSHAYMYLGFLLRLVHCIFKILLKRISTQEEKLKYISACKYESTTSIN